MASKKRWMQKASDRMQRKGTEGAFSRKAKAAGMSTAAYARKVLAAPKGRYSAETRKQANFALNAIRASRK